MVLARYTTMWNYILQSYMNIILKTYRALDSTKYKNITNNLKHSLILLLSDFIHESFPGLISVYVKQVWLL